MSTRTKAANPILEAALQYVEHGWAILPVAPRSKKPCSELLPVHSHTGKPSWSLLGAKRATREVVLSWFERRPDINIGVICGQPSGGLIVADFDEHIPREWVMPLTPRATPSRLEHVYLQSPCPIDSHCLLHNGVRIGELRSDGGYVVAPPSIHTSGAIYAWSQGMSPEDLCWTLADAPSWALQPDTRNQSPREQGEQVNIGYLLPRSDQPIDYLLTHCSDEFVVAVAQKVGIDPDKATGDGLGKAFCCVLPRHEENKPSASLYRHANGRMIYHDWHCRTRDAHYLLAEVYASQAYKEPRKLKAPELATWHIRLLVETGQVEPAEVLMPPLPKNAKPVVRRVYEGFKLLLQCKWIYEPGAPTAFSWRFAAAWCGVPQRYAGEAVQELLKMGVIRIVGKHRGTPKPMAVFLPGPK